MKYKSSYLFNLKSPFIYRKFLRRYSDESSDFDTSRKPRRKVRNYYFYESIKYTVSYYPLIPKVKRFIRSYSRYSSILRSKRRKLKDNRPK